MERALPAFEGTVHESHAAAVARASPLGARRAGRAATSTARWCGVRWRTLL